MAEFVEGRLNGDYGEKMVALAQKIEEQTQQRLRDDDLACQANLDNAKTYIRIGKKYDKIDIGGSGKLMVERETGNIFGIKAYGKIHRGHFFGTLDTIDDWYWGEYRPITVEQNSKRIRIRFKG